MTTDQTPADHFKPSDKSRELWKRFNEDNNLSETATNEFFEFWDVENDPLRAGSLVAHRYAHYAARFAVFGAASAGKAPRLELFLEVCTEHFNKAVEDVGFAFAETETEATEQNSQVPA